MAVGAINLQDRSSDGQRFQPGLSDAPACPVCATPRARYWFSKHDYPVYQCGKCKLEFLHPQPADNVLAAIYSKDYFLGDGTTESAERTVQLKSATACLYLDRLSRMLRESGGRLLEVGCGTGEFLAQARGRGFEVGGIEYSSTAAEIANQRLGPGTVHTGTLESATLPSEYFNAIVACDVIEHVREPKSFLARAHACLQPGGLLFLVTPSVDSWSRKWMRSRWMEYKVEHLFYFGEASVRQLFAISNFERPEFHSNQKAVSLDYVYHHFRRYSVPLLTPFISGLRHLLPGRAVYRQWNIAGSGVIAIAYKPLSAKTASEM